MINNVNSLESFKILFEKIDKANQFLEKIITTYLIAEINYFDKNTHVIKPNIIRNLLIYEDIKDNLYIIVNIKDDYHLRYISHTKNNRVIVRLFTYECIYYMYNFYIKYKEFDIDKLDIIFYSRIIELYDTECYYP